MHRSFHFAPAHQKRFLDKALDLAADAVILELEDGVGDADKEEARRGVKEFFAANGREGFFVRVNQIGTADWSKDRELLDQAGPPPGIVLPKVESAESVAEACAGLRSCDTPPPVIAIIESFAALDRAAEIASAPNVIGVGLGMEDLLAESPHPASALTELVSSVKSTAVLAARAHGRFALDSISTELADMDQFRSDCVRSRSEGFDGRFVIHPLQIAVANEIYAPDAAQVTWAREVVELSGGDGSAGYRKIDGRLVSGPMVKKAITVLAKQ